MVCRSEKYTTESKMFSVLEISPLGDPKENESVTQIAEFWDSVLAMDYTEAYSKIYK